MVGARLPPTASVQGTKRSPPPPPAQGESWGLQTHQWYIKPIYTAHCGQERLWCQTGVSGETWVRTLVQPIRQRRRRQRAPTRIRTADRKICGWVRYHSTGGGCDTNILTPPPHHTPPPPLKKVLSSFRGWRPQNQKIHWVMVLMGKIMILQGVGHQISCLVVCYANIRRPRLRLI